MIKFGLIIIVLIYSFKIEAQDMYFGGNGSGDVVSCFWQPVSSQDSMYNGGNEDGFAVACFSQVFSTTNNFYFGGVDDGYAIACVDQSDPSVDSLYAGGGDNDGFSVTCYEQVYSTSNSFYFGGIDDGYAISCYVQPDTSADNIFVGGDVGSVMTCYNQAYSATKGMYSGVGTSAGFAFGCAGSLNNEVPLPIELLSFDAVLNGDKVDLLWSTMTEINNDYFIVEKTTDDVNFEEVATVNGAGNSSFFLSYSAIDKTPYRGISYYRLKQVDFDGNYSYSNLIPIRYVKDMQIKIFPNPVDGNLFYLSINNESGQELKLMLYNILGEIVYATSFTQQRGTILKRINLPDNLVTGVYFVAVKSKDKLFKQKLMIK